MQEMQVPIICGDKITDNIDYSDAIPRNMVAVIRDVLGNNGYLVSHDGMGYLQTLYGVDRGALYNERWKRSFRVSGKYFCELNTASNVPVNTVYISGEDKASMSYSFQSVMIVADGFAWRFDGLNLVKYADPDLGSPIDAAWIDSYYVFTDGEYIYHTDINDETSINPLKFATSELSPDPTKALGRTQDNLLIVFNRYTTEYFINQGNDNFAFSRINQKAVNAGIVGTHAWCEMEGNIFILGGRKEEATSFHILNSGSTTSLSTRYIDKLINKYSDAELALAVIESRIVARDKLIYLYLPNEVLLYNHSIAEKLGVGCAWSILTSGSNGGKWIARNGIYDPLINKWVYGTSSKFGYVIYMDPTTAAQFPNPDSDFSLQPSDMCWYTPLIPLGGASIDEIELNTVSGFQSTAATVFISTTRDGAIYSQEWSKEIAAPFEYSKNCIYRRLGYVRKNIGFKFRCLSKQKINVSGLVVRYG